MSSVPPFYWAVRLTFINILGGRGRLPMLTKVDIPPGRGTYQNLTFHARNTNSKTGSIRFDFEPEKVRFPGRFWSVFRFK